jgi:superoxide dismutase
VYQYQADSSNFDFQREQQLREWYYKEVLDRLDTVIDRIPNVNRTREEVRTFLKNVNMMYTRTQELLEKLDTIIPQLSNDKMKKYKFQFSNICNSDVPSQMKNSGIHLAQPVSRHEDDLPFSVDRDDYQSIPIGGHILPPLPYPYDALEPYIDEKTMRLHHDHHHKSYVEGLNKAEKEMLKARESGDFSLIKHWEREAAFNGAGHYLHTIFWNTMNPRGGGEATGEIAHEINRTFGSFQKFKQHFSAAAEKVEGSGWAMLIWSPRSHRVEILQVEKHQNLSQHDIVPLMVLDVWEHAYYLKYQNNRRSYIDAWWNIVNWDEINSRFKQARNLRWQPF